MSRKISFEKSEHTIIVSDIHLSTAEPVHPKDPLWKRYKQREFFIDDAFEAFLKKLGAESPDGPVELIMAGDIFDFDSVTQLPETHRFKISWLEKKRGLNAEERKSRFKIRKIIDDHPVFFKALKNFVKKGNRIVFIIGNHDLELHWPSVQRQILKTLALTPEEQEHIRFTNWFYISNKDSLIEHGNQHDSHNNCPNPVNPKIKGLYRERIRLPFGSYANRNMMNGMGYFNPHSERTFIMSLYAYTVFFFKHLIRKEPLLVWTWFWGAVTTLLVTIRDGLKPEVKDPLTVEDQIEEIAEKSNASPKIVRLLKEVHAPPAIFDLPGVMRELWLDRAFLVAMVLLGALYLVSVLNLIFHVSVWWVFGAFVLFIPFFIFYFRSVNSKIMVDVKYYEKAIALGSKITGVKRVVYGHTHEFMHANVEGVEYLNSGTWSPAFIDFECTKPAAPKTFVWIRPDPEKPGTRQANVFEWKDGKMTLLC